jgi:hypothetical protein
LAVTSAQQNQSFKDLIKNAVYRWDAYSFLWC